MLLQSLVLIETYWNVNKEFAEMSENRVEY